MQEDLLGYVLGALDGPEHDEVQDAVTRNEPLRGQLLELEQRLEPLEDVRWDFDPPAGLATSTCQLVAEFAAEQAAKAEPVRPASTQTGWSSTDGSGHGSSWNFIDFVVAAGISVAAAMMFFPAVANSRYQSRLAGCQNNLRMFGAALPLFAENGSGKLPYIPPHGKTGVAGFYAPQLMDAGYVKQHKLFVCPSSPLATKSASFFVPDIDTIQRARGAKLVALQRRMGGSYCYGLGHFEQGQHRPTRARSRSRFAVMSDHVFLPGSNQQVPVHGMQGLNILFEDGHVRFILIRNVQPNNEQSLDWSQLFVSDRGIVEAGLHADDAVLAPSWVRPIPGEADWSPNDLQLHPVEL
jgi:hypothetical protein